MKKFFSLLIIFLFSLNFYAQKTNTIDKSGKYDLKLASDDLLVVLEADGEKVSDGNGFHLYIRKRGDINSVLLAESTKDPKGKIDNLAYRATEYNHINGDEVRFLNGKKLDSKFSKYSLIATTVEWNEHLGECFHIYVPKKIVYGYSWDRHGEIEVGEGTFFNIRTFQKNYCDYSGKYDDNPFRVKFLDLPKEERQEVAQQEKVVEEKIEPKVTKKEYKTKAEETFNQIAQGGKGNIYYSFGARQLPKQIDKIMKELENHDKVEIVFAIDATGSMSDDFWELSNVWIPSFRNQIKKYKEIRLGLLLYKDYGEEYNFNRLPVKFFNFTNSIDEFAKWVKAAYIKGGGDKPEAVYEALYASLEYYNWSPTAKKKIVLIGDAEPHDTPKGPVTVDKELVEEIAFDKNITFDCIIIMDESYKKIFDQEERERKEKELKDANIKAIESTETTASLLKSVEDLK